MRASIDGTSARIVYVFVKRVKKENKNKNNCTWGCISSLPVPYAK